MKLSDYEFFCPSCSVRLDSDKVIHLNTKRNNGDEGEISLSTTFGNYGYNHNPIVAFENGELINFYCPKCHKKVHSSIKPDFVALTMRVEKKYDFELLFSRKHGIQKTFIVTEDGVERFGRDSSNEEF